MRLVRDGGRSAILPPVSGLGAGNTLAAAASLFDERVPTTLTDCDTFLSFLALATLFSSLLQ